MEISALQETASFFLPRWSELKTRDKQIKSILLTNNSFALLGSAFITNALHRLHINPVSVTENEGCLHDDEQLARLLEAIKEEDLPFLAESAHADACAPGNPKDASVEDLKALFRKIM